MSHARSAPRCTSPCACLFDPQIPGTLHLPFDVLNTGPALTFGQEGDLAELHRLELIARIELGIDRAIDGLANGVSHHRGAVAAHQDDVMAIEAFSQSAAKMIAADEQVG